MRPPRAIRVDITQNIGTTSNTALQTNEHISSNLTTARLPKKFTCVISYNTIISRENISNKVARALLKGTTTTSVEYETTQRAID